MAYIAANKIATSDQHTRHMSVQADITADNILRKIANIKRGAITVDCQQAMHLGKPTEKSLHSYPDGKRYRIYKGLFPDSPDTLRRWGRDERTLAQVPAYCKPD